MRTAVVYYSMEGNTKLAANEIAVQKQADLFELKEAKDRKKGIFNFIKCGFQAAAKRHTRLTDDFCDRMKEYDVIYIGSPVWASSSSPAVNEFVLKNDFNAKQVHLIFVGAETDPAKKPQNGIDHLSDMVRKAGGNVSGSLVLTGGAPGKPAPEEEIRRQVRSRIE